MAQAAVVAFKKVVLTPVHVSTLNQLSAAPKSATVAAAALGIPADEAVRKLSFLVDEGLAVQVKTASGATTNQYQTS